MWCPMAWHLLHCLSGFVQPCHTIMSWYDASCGTLQGPPIGPPALAPRQRGGHMPYHPAYGPVYQWQVSLCVAAWLTCGEIITTLRVAFWINERISVVISDYERDILETNAR